MNAMTTAGPNAEYCQSCAMEMEDGPDYGTEADDSPSADYCTHCYQDGEFVDPDLTIDQMSAIVADFIEADEVTMAEAKAISKTLLSQLRRWQ